MSQSLHTVSETAALIQSGKTLLLAGDEATLRALPRGRWIGGTIPYFMTEQGGQMSRDHVFVSELPALFDEIVTRSYDVTELANVYRDAPPNGLSVVILPAATEVHSAFAVGAPQYPGFGTRPLVGWIAGVHVGDLGKVAPKVFLGADGSSFTDRAVVLHASLPRTKAVDIGIVNLFTPGDGEVFTFPESSFKASKVLVDGKEHDLAKYFTEKGLDAKLPLVADYGGASINVSVQSVDVEKGEVTFYAPVFAGIAYRQAKAIPDYVSEFVRRLPPDEAASDMVFSCNCILNYLYSELEGKKTGSITGPITFGEVAYQLLNQTLAYARIVDVG